MAFLTRLLLGLMLTLSAILPVRAQDLSFDDLMRLMAGRFSSLTEPLAVTEPALTLPCDFTAPGRTFALLVGATSFGPLSTATLSGSETSVALVAASLATRGVDPGRITLLTGPKANREALTQAASAVLAQVSCTDMVFLYITGVTGTTQGMSELMTNGAYTDDWIAGMSDRVPDLRPIVNASPFLLLDPTDGPVEELISAAALSELVTRLRNRTAHVTLALDTTYAGAFDLAARQVRVDEGMLWRQALGSAPAEGATPLVARAGAFSVMYGADRNSMAAEMQLPEGDPDASVYGLFAFKLGTALATDAALTVPSLGRQMAAMTLAPHYTDYQNHVIETTDATLPVLAELMPQAVPQAPLAPDLGPAAPGSPDVIRISSPSPTRAAAALEQPDLLIEGRVEWPEDTLIVLVGREQALSRADGSFAHTVTLAEGLNRIEIVALTRDNRQHTRTLEVTFAGDMAALAGQGRRFALLIGNQGYGGSTGMPALATPFADVDALAVELTTRYGFVTEAPLPDGGSLPLLLKDATRAQIETALFQLSLVAGEADQVLIWYGGHGVFEQVTGTAFWVPADAIAGVPPSYVSASGISEALLRLQAGSVIVISDSCYSGALLRDGGVPPATIVSAEDRSRMLQRLTERRSRVLVTSGANEPVADGGGDGHSVFARAFLTALREARGPFSAREMFDGFILPMVVGRAEQEPQFRPIQKSGHEGGDFVFVPLDG